MALKARPTRATITAILPEDQTPGRTNVTIGDFIVEQIKAGVDPVNAAGAVGVMPSEFQAWMREGTLTINRVNSGTDWNTAFTAEQQDCALLAERVIRAHSQHISRLTIVSEQLARGGIDTERRVRKSVNGQVVEEVVTTSKTLPDGDMIKWKLEKLEPQVYGPKATLNVTVSDMTDTEAVADVVLKRMNEIAASLRARAIEATATDG